MTHARMFKPMRHVPEGIDSGESRETRVAVQSVTNTPPPGPAPTPEQEEGWLALLELVFEQTGWPDAQDQDRDSDGLTLR